MGILSQQQANFILSSRLKKVTPSIAHDFSFDDGYEAFKDLRWGWNGGKSMCPHCFHERLYEFADRDKFKCARCGRQFSTTTATAFKSRKMPHKSYIHAISIKLHDPMSIMELGQRLSVEYKTAWRLNKILGLIKGNIRTPAIDRVYPYAPMSPKTDGADLVHLVNSHVGKGVPEHIRADICQEVILGVLEGEITIESVAKQVQQYVRKFWGKFDWKHGEISLDQPMRDGRSWHDVIEDKHERMDNGISDDFFGYERLDEGEYGFKTKDDRTAFYSEKKFSNQRKVGLDRYEQIERTRGISFNPTLNAN